MDPSRPVLIIVPSTGSFRRQITVYSGRSVSGWSSAMTAERGMVPPSTKTAPGSGSSMVIEMSHSGGGPVWPRSLTLTRTVSVPIKPSPGKNASTVTSYLPSQNVCSTASPVATLANTNGTPALSYDQERISSLAASSGAITASASNVTSTPSSTVIACAGCEIATNGGSSSG